MAKAPFTGIGRPATTAAAPNFNTVKQQPAATGTFKDRVAANLAKMKAARAPKPTVAAPAPAPAKTAPKPVAAPRPVANSGNYGGTRTGPMSRDQRSLAQGGGLGGGLKGTGIAGKAVSAARLATGGGNRTASPTRTNGSPAAGKGSASQSKSGGKKK